MTSKDQVKVVVVEDDSAQRRLIEVVLAADNFEIHSAVDGVEGIELIRKELPSAIVADVMMPSLDGFEMCRRLRTDPRTAHIPIIFVTARATMDDKLRAFDLGADDYLTKPYVPAELLSRVKAVLRRAKAAPPGTSTVAEPEEPSEKDLAVAKLLSSSPGVLLAGRLSTASVLDVLQTIHWGTISGRLSVSARSFGSIELRHGRLIHARVVASRGNIYGMKAWLRLASWSQGVFELRDLGDEPATPMERTIDAPLQNLMLEAAYYRDEYEKLMGRLSGPHLVLERVKPPEQGADRADWLVWSSISDSGIELERLMDQLDFTDLEVLQLVFKLLSTGFLAAKLARHPGAGSR